jgi:hypothetical protein
MIAVTDASLMYTVSRCHEALRYELVKFLRQWTLGFAVEDVMSQHPMTYQRQVSPNSRTGARSEQ